MCIRDSLYIERLSGTLEPLSNLEYIGEEISILECDEITTLQPLSGVKNLPNGPIEIESNEFLQDCNIPLICRFIAEKPDGKISIENNTDGCRFNDLDCDLFDINGTVFFDRNENGILDAEEVGIPNIRLESNKGVLLTNSNGGYSLFLNQLESFRIKLEDNSEWELTSSPIEYDGIFDNQSAMSTFNFGLKPSFNEHRANVFISSENIRCSEEGSYFIRVQNTGTFRESGEIHFHYDDRMIFLSSEEEPDFIDEQASLIVWEYGIIEPFQILDFEVKFLMPDFMNAGEILTSSLDYFVLEGNALEEITGHKYETILRCSYDPNDKQISPVGRSEEAYIIRDEPVVYTLRFQNTGNDYARNIRLIDTLPNEFDMNSLKVTNSSHNHQTSINGQEVTFEFKNIFLIDSLTSPEESQGFISFEIRLDTLTPDFTVVENSADIFFDFNPPIRTNTVTNTVVEEFPTSSTTSINQVPSFVLYPNPTDNLINIRCSHISPPRSYSILDFNGKILKRGRASNSFQLSTEELVDGLYLVRIDFANGHLVTEKVLLHKR